jgi:CheY-like chemotaxis protein
MILNQDPKPLKILLVEDNDDYRRTIMKMIHNSPYLQHNYVYEIQTPASDLELNKVIGLRYDLVLADYFLNWKKEQYSQFDNGLSVIKTVYSKNEKSNLTLYSTNKETLQDVKQSLAHGIGDRLKTITKEDIKNKLRNQNSLTDVIQIKEAILDKIIEASAPEKLNSLPPGHAPVENSKIKKVLLHQVAVSELSESESFTFINCLIVNLQGEQNVWLINDKKFVSTNKSKKEIEANSSITEVVFHFDNNDAIVTKVDVNSGELSFTYTIPGMQTLASAEKTHFKKHSFEYTFVRILNSYCLLANYIANYMSLDNVFGTLHQLSEDTKMYYLFMFYEYSVLKRKMSFGQITDAIKVYVGKDYVEVLNIYYCQIEEICGAKDEDESDVAIVNMRCISDIDDILIYKINYEELQENNIHFENTCFKLIVFKTNLISKAFRYENLQLENFNAVIG